MPLSREEKLRILDATKDLVTGLVSPRDVWSSPDDVRQVSDFNVKFKMLYMQVHSVVLQQYLTLGESADPDAGERHAPSPRDDSDDVQQLDLSQFVAPDAAMDRQGLTVSGIDLVDEGPITGR